MSHNLQQSAKLKKHLKWLTFIAIGMFGFAFALVPFYNAFCKVTGLNGKPVLNGMVADPVNTHIDTSRFVNVQLTANTDAYTQAEFEPEHKKYTFHPGEFVQTNFRVKNLTDKPMTIQAIPSVSPGQGAKHVKKIVCFCFQKQELGPNQEMIMPLRFTVTDELPKRYKTLTLSYTLFDVTQR
jgi:cytochrome c oxidase assembly protein subunit 11